MGDSGRVEPLRKGGALALVSLGRASESAEGLPVLNSESRAPVPGTLLCRGRGALTQPGSVAAPRRHGGGPRASPSTSCAPGTALGAAGGDKGALAELWRPRPGVPLGGPARSREGAEAMGPEQLGRVKGWVR